LVDLVDDQEVYLQADGALVVYFLEGDAQKDDHAEDDKLDVHPIYNHKMVDDHSHMNSGDYGHTNHHHTKHNPTT
jgi:hypothetical protein